VSHFPLIDKYSGEYTNAQLLVDERGKRIFMMIQVKLQDKEVVKKNKTQM